jgi:hypothetical protein
VAGPDVEPIDASTLLDRALTAYRALADLGEQIEDEWQYVNDLVEVWSAELRAAVVAPTTAVDAEQVDAVELAIDEIGRIEDPHRAIDWLSTFPQIVRLAILGPVAAA